MGRKRGERFPGFRRRPFKPLDSYFSSGKPTKREQKEWRDWHGDYKEKDYFKQYLREVKTIPNCDADALIRQLKEYKDIASFNCLIGSHLKIVPKIAYRRAKEYGHKPAGIVRDPKKAWQGYEVVVQELIAAGNAGLLEAVKRFRPEAGVQFNTAARYSIEKEIRKHAEWLRSIVHIPEGKPSGWYKSLTTYNDDANEYQGEADVAVGGIAVSAYQLVDDAKDADPADPVFGAADFSGMIYDQACLDDLDLAATALTNKRERDIFRAHYIHGETLKTIAARYGIGFRRVSQIARAARDKILKINFDIKNVNLRALLPQWRAAEEWLDALRRCNDVALIHTRGRLARIWEPHERYYKRVGVFPLEVANRLALWRLAEFEREDISTPGRNRILLATVKPPEKKERWRKRKSDIPGLWEPLTEFWKPSPIRALWTFRETYPGRIHVAIPARSWPAQSAAARRWELRKRQQYHPRKIELPEVSRPYISTWIPRPKWRKQLRPSDWQFSYQRRKGNEALQFMIPLKKAAA